MEPTEPQHEHRFRTAAADDYFRSAYDSMWVLRALDDKRRWLVAYRVAPENGQAVIAEIRIVPMPRTRGEEDWFRKSLEDPDVEAIWGPVSHNVDAEYVPRPPEIPEGGLPMRALRHIRTSDAFADARQYQRMLPGSPLLRGLTEEVLKAPRRPGRSGRNDRFYAELAAAYVETIDAGSRTPVKDLTAKLREQELHYTEPSVRDLIHDARRRGLLTASPKGRAGGRLTDKAIAALRD